MQGRAQPRRRPPHAHRRRRRSGAGGVALAAFAVLVGCVALAGPVRSIVGTLGSSDARSAGPAAEGDLPGAGSGNTAAPIGSPDRVPVTTAVEPGTASPAPGGPAPAQAGTVVASHFGLGLLIADRGNGRLLIVNHGGRTLWRFPVAGSLPRGQAFSADDAFIAPDGRTIVANDEAHQVIDRIDIASRKVVWQYGQYARARLRPRLPAHARRRLSARQRQHHGRRHPELPDPGDLAGEADRPPVGARRATAPTTRRAASTTRTATRRSPTAGCWSPTIGGSRVVRLSASGRVRFDIHVPAAYPSDAQLDPKGNVLVVDYSTIRVHRQGQLARPRPVAVPGAHPVAGGSITRASRSCCRTGRSP